MNTKFRFSVRNYATFLYSSSTSSILRRKMAYSGGPVVSRLTANQKSLVHALAQEQFSEMPNSVKHSVMTASPFPLPSAAGCIASFSAGGASCRSAVLSSGGRDGDIEDGT